MQYYADVAEILGITGNRAEDFAELLVRLGRAQDDAVETARAGNDVLVQQTTWRLMQGVRAPSTAVFDAWNALWEGALSVHNRRLVLDVRQRLDRGDPCLEWRIRAWGAT
jgi:hypothetical protein